MLFGQDVSNHYWSPGTKGKWSCPLHSSNMLQDSDREVSSLIKEPKHSGLNDQQNVFEINTWYQICPGLFNNKYLNLYRLQIHLFIQFHPTWSFILISIQ